MKSHFAKRFTSSWFPVVAWAGLIFYLSSLPSLETGFSEAADFLFRKVGHVFVYGVLTLLVFQALRHGHAVETKKALIGAVAIALLYGISDEAHQRYVPGRHGRARDVLVDTVGVGAAAIFLRRQRPS